MKLQLAFLACAAALFAATDAQGQLPRGSYQQSCTDATVNKNVLKAKCKPNSGPAVDTSLNLPCSGVIDNINGKLTCSAANAATAPQGGYLQTCAGAKVENNVLTADCRRADQTVAKASLALPCAGRIDNLDGKLSCVGGTPPKGSYQDSCTGAALNENVLTARCRTMAGTMVGSKLTLPCVGKIDNINGVLTCSAGATASGVPQGSYLETCSGAKVIDNVLRADCRRANQTVAKGATLTLPCNKSIHNMDGKLTCR